LESGKPIWNIFYPKIPVKVIAALQTERRYRKHLLGEGTERAAWTMSYSAGSAVGINTHFAAAEELDLSPVTDSPLHHRLMLMKLVRGKSAVGTEGVGSSRATDQISKGIALRVMQQVLPKTVLETIPLEDILQFRERSDPARRHFFSAIQSEMRQVVKGADISKVLTREEIMTSKILNDVKKYRDEILGLRDRLWPDLVGVLGKQKNLATASGAGLGLLYIQGPAAAIAASIVIPVVQALRVALKYRADVRKRHRSASPAVSYLAQIDKTFGQTHR
jgi:hypothetical protein